MACPFGNMELNGEVITKGTEGVFTIYDHIPYITHHPPNICESEWNNINILLTLYEFKYPRRLLIPFYLKYVDIPQLFIAYV